MGLFHIPGDVQGETLKAFREIDDLFQKILSAQTVDWKGRQLVNVADAISRIDVPNLGQVLDQFSGDDFRAAVQAIVQSLQPPTKPNTYPPIDKFMFADDFETGSGVPLWTIQAGSVSMQTAVSSHPGIVRVASPAVLNNIGRIARSSSATVGMMLVEQCDRFEWVVNPTTNVAKKLRIGFTENTGTVAGDNGIYFRHNTGTTNWEFVTKAGGTTTATDTGIAFATATWFKLSAIRISDTEWWAYINDALVAKNTTNVPTGAEVFCLMIETNDGNAKQCDVDFASVEALASIGTRF
jgi:hypothetical protein